MEKVAKVILAVSALQMRFLLMMKQQFMKLSLREKAMVILAGIALLVAIVI